MKFTPLMKAVSRMTLDDDAIQEFQKLYSKEYGIKLSRAQAIEYGTKLIDLISIVSENGAIKFLDGQKRGGYHEHGDNEKHN